jgi:small GTP-binding protein
MSARSAKRKRQVAADTFQQPNAVHPSTNPQSFQEEQDFLDQVGELFEERKPDFSKTVNIALLGKVSSGKSSLLNAILMRERDNPAAQVGATSGVTTKLKCFRLDGDDHVLIIDSPGLDDVVAENSQETARILHHIDLGILVVTGSADASQKSHYDQLCHHAKKVFVVLNKIDEWDHLEQGAVDEVVKQWESVLGTKHIYRVCTKGYDPKARKDVPLELKGVEQLREDMLSFLAKERKDLLFARHLGDKRPYAVGIIAAALASVAGEAFIPGSAAYITATQAITITALYYLHTGRILSKSSALAALPSLAAKNVGMHLFLWAKSFLPPTGIVDAAAAAVAVLVTLAILVTVNSVFTMGADLHERELLKEKYGETDQRIKNLFTGVTLTKLSDPNFRRQMVYKVMFS